MATDLAAQLAQVAARAGADTKRSKGQASLLYDSRAASDVGIEQIYDIALQGFEELVQIDPQLARFQDTLLGRAAVGLDIAQHTAEENEQLDAEVGRLCHSLVPHFQLKAATAVLELLVRQYRLHERHAQRTLAIFAPYHCTAEYARLVQISRIEATPFKILKGVKDSGATVPRPALVKCCCKDKALLATLCEAVTAGHKLGVVAPVATAFYSALIIETLLATPAPYPDSLLQTLLPHLLIGLAPSATTELRVATLTITSCMMTLTTLSEAVIVSLVSDACMHVNAASLRETLLFVAVAFETQQCMRSGFQGGPREREMGAKTDGPGQKMMVPVLAAGQLLRQPGLRNEIEKLRKEKWCVELLAGALACAAPLEALAAQKRLEGLEMKWSVGAMMAKVLTNRVEVEGREDSERSEGSLHQNDERQGDIEQAKGETRMDYMHAAVELVRGLKLNEMRARMVCTHAVQVLESSDTREQEGACAVVAELQKLPECAQVMTEAIQAVMHDAKKHKRLHRRLLKALAESTVQLPALEENEDAQKLPEDFARSLGSVLQERSGSRYDSAVLQLQRMHGAGRLDADTVETVRQVATRDLPSTSHGAVMAALSSPLLAILPAEEKVPQLLKCLRGVSTSVANALPCATSQLPEDSRTEGSFAARWKWAQLRDCAKKLLALLCKAATGHTEWEKEIVVLATPWLLARKWGDGGVQYLIQCLEVLHIWCKIAGASSPTTRTDENAGTRGDNAQTRTPQQHPASGGGLLEEKVLEGSAGTSSRKKSKRSSRSSDPGAGTSGGTQGFTPESSHIDIDEHDDVTDGGDAEVGQEGGSAKKRRRAQLQSDPDSSGTQVKGSDRKALQNVQERIARKLHTDPDAWSALHAIHEHCTRTYANASRSSTEASRRLVTMHVITLGVHKAWADAWAEKCSGGSEITEGCGTLWKCGKWILAAVCEVSRAAVATGEFVDMEGVGEVPSDVAEVATWVCKHAKVSKEHMKRLEASATSAAVTVVRDASHAMLATCMQPAQALALWKHVLCCGYRELVCCVLAADPSATFGTSFGEVAWRLMHVQHMAFEEDRRHQGLANSGTEKVSNADEENGVAGGALGATDKSNLHPPPQPSTVLNAIVATPDDTPGISMTRVTVSSGTSGQNSSENHKPVEIRPRAMALIPIAAAGNFSDQKLLDPSCRATMLKNACNDLTSTSQRLEVLISALCALCSKSTVLRAHACSITAALLKGSNADSPDDLEQGLVCIAMAICDSRKALEASPDALQNVLSVSQVTGTHDLIMHALCPCVASDKNSDLHQDEGLRSVTGVDSGAMRSCMEALTVHGPHALKTMFRVLCQQIGDYLAAVAVYAYVPCIMMNVVALLQQGVSSSGIMELVLDILKCFRNLPESQDIPDSVQKCLDSMHGDHAFEFHPSTVLRAPLQMKFAPKIQGVSATVAQHAYEVSTAARHLVLDTVLPAAWPNLSSGDKLQLSPCLLQAACSEPSAACRVAAQATLDAVRIPLASLTAPLVATSSSVTTLVATDDTQLRDSFCALMSAREGSEKRRKVEGVATCSNVEQLNSSDATAYAWESYHTSDDKIGQLLMEDSESARTVRACMGWKHDEPGVSNGQVLALHGSILAAVSGVMHEESNVGETAALTIQSTRIKKIVMQKVLEESVPVLEALQTWSPVKQSVDVPTDDDENMTKSSEIEDPENSISQVLASLQVFLTACRQILTVPDDVSGNVPEHAAHSEQPTDPSTSTQTAVLATYATKLALTAVLRVIKLGHGTCTQPASLIGAAFPLAAFIDNVIQLEGAAIGFMHTLLEVLVATLHGATQADIEGVLPQLMKFTVGASQQGGDGDPVTNVATVAVSAAARAWVATGGKPAAFLRSLSNHLGATSSTRRAALSAAALKQVCSSEAQKGLSSSLKTFCIILLSPGTKPSNSSPSRSIYEGEEVCEKVLSPEDSFSTLTSIFQQFPWQIRLGAVHKLLRNAVDKKTGGAASLAPQILTFALSQVRATVNAPTSQRTSDAVQKVLEKILVSSLGFQGTVAKASKSNPLQQRCFKLLKALLDALKAALLPSFLFKGVLASMHTTGHSDTATRLSLRMLSSSAPLAFQSSAQLGGSLQPHAAAAQAACHAAQVAAGAVAGGADAPSPETRRAASTAVAAVAAATADAAEAAAAAAAAGGSKAAGAAAAAAAAAACAEALVPALPQLAAAAAAAQAAVRVAALTAAASVVAAAGAAAVEHVTPVAEAALSRAEAYLHTTTSTTTTASESTNEPLELTAALETCTALMSTVPGLLFPFLQRMVAVLHHPHTLRETSSLDKSVATSARSALTHHIEFRLLVPAVNQNLSEAEAHGSDALVATMHTLTRAVDELSPAVAVAHVDTVAEVVLKVLDVRGRSMLRALEASPGEAACAAIDAQAVEDSTYQAAVAFILKLNENQFKKLFSDLCSWAKTVPSYVASATSSDIRTAACTARRTAWFGFVSQLSRALRSVFTPYYEDLLEGFIEVLTKQSEDSVPLIGSSKKSKKGRKSSDQTSEASRSIEEVTMVAQNRAVSCIHRFRMHDVNASLTHDRYLALLNPLVARLAGAESSVSRKSDGADVAPGKDTILASGDQDLLDTVQSGSRTHSQLSDSALGTIAAIVALAMSTREEVLWKKTNYQVLLVSRSDIAVNRLAAMECMYNIVGRLKEDFLGLLPESLPFLSELLEDSDSAVLARSRDLVKLLEDLSDEKLDDYLKP